MIGPVALSSVFLSAIGTVFQLYGVWLTREYLEYWFRNKAPGKLAQVVEYLIQKLWAVESRTRRLLGFKPRPRVHEAKTRPLTGGSRLGGSPTVVLHWGNGGMEESIAELRRVAQRHQEDIYDLRGYIKTLEGQIEELKPSWQQDIATAKERSDSDPKVNWGVALILFGIILVGIGSIIGTIWG